MANLTYTTRIEIIYSNFRKLYVLAGEIIYSSPMHTTSKLMVLDILEQTWKTYPSHFNSYETFGKMIALRGRLLYFHELAITDILNTDLMKGSIYHVLENGTMTDLNVEKPFMNEIDYYNSISTIQIAPFSRTFFKNVKTFGPLLQYKT